MNEEEFDEMSEDTADMAINLLEELHDLPSEADLNIPVAMVRALCAGYLMLYQMSGGEIDEETIH